MLRVPPTKITMNSRDVEWHDQRHEHRQLLRDNGQPIDVTGSPVKDQKVDDQKLPYRLPYHVNYPPSMNADTSTDLSHGSDLISREPIPRGRKGKAFWNKVVLDAGAPSGILIQHIDRQPQVVDQAGKSPDIIHSSRASIDENVSAS